MSIFNKKNLLSDLHDRTEVVRRNVRPFQQLTNAQLTLKPMPVKWSIAEVFEHLNLAHGIYLASINAQIENAPINNKDIYNSSWIGNFIYNKIIPRPDGTVYKMKAPGFMHAQNNDLDGKKVIEKYLQQLNDFDHILEQSRYIDIQKIRIPLSFARFVRLRLGDCLRFIAAHNERHLLQAHRMLTVFIPEVKHETKLPAPKPSDLVNVL